MNSRFLSQVTTVNAAVITAPALPVANVGSIAIAPTALQASAHTAVTPTAAPTASIVAHHPAFALKVDAVRFLDPVLAGAIANIPFETNGVTRDKLTVPVSPQPDVTDRLLFEAAADATKKFYLPRYRLAQQQVSGQAAYRALLARGGGGGTLTLYLEKYAAPEIGAAGNSANELAIQLPSLLLKYVLAGSGGIQKELLFQEVTEEAGLLRAVLRVGTLPEYDELFRALTSADYKTALIVRRTAKVAVKVEQPKVPAQIGSGTASLRGTWMFNFDTGAESTAGDVWWEQQTSTARRMTPRGKAGLAWLGQADFDSLTLEKLQANKYESAAIEGSLNNVPGATLFAIPVWLGVYDTHQLGVWYDAGRGQWSVFHQDMAPMQDGAQYCITRPADSAFVHTAAANTISGHITYVDNPLTNNNPTAILFATPNWLGVYENKSIGVWYDAGRAKWSIFNQDMSAMPAGAAFNVEVEKLSDSVFIHRAAPANTSGHVTYIDHPLANNNPNALLMASQNWLGVYNTHPIGVWYDTGRAKWSVFNQDMAAMPAGAAFNVIIRRPPTMPRVGELPIGRVGIMAQNIPIAINAAALNSREAFVHRVERANTSGHCTYFELPNTARNLLTAGNVFSVLTNGGNYAKVKVLEYGYNLKLQWVTYPKTGARPDIFREVTRVLDDTSSPFLFDRDVHRSVFADIPAAGGSTQGIRPWPVKWKTATHNYYQEVARPEIFYYLPDTFKLARRPQSPHVPLMAMRFESPDGLPETTQVRLEYTAFKYEDSDRLADAVEQLRKLPNCLPPGVTTPTFLPLTAVPEKTKFYLRLPRVEGASQLQLRESAELKINSGVAMCDMLSLTLNDFESVWEAMNDTTGAALLFSGEVRINVCGENVPVPFSGRINDMEGDLFDPTGVPDQASGSLQMTLRNAIESPIRIKGLKAGLTRGSAGVAAQLQGLTFPVDVPPGEAINFKLTPASPLAGSDPVTAELYLDEVEVLPDIDKLWSLLNLSQRPEYTRKIKVKTNTSLFDVPANPQDQITELDVSFRNGATVTLSAARLEADVPVRCPMYELFTHQPDAGGYKYMVTATRKDGSSRDGAEQTDTRELLRIDVSKVPPAR